jgi:tRNA-dihydrouridine synthase B
VDLDGFAAAAALSRHCVMYNGDIKDVATFIMLQERFPFVKEWMVGRWAIYNPFLPSLLKGTGQKADRAASIRAFHDELYSAYGEILFGPKHLLDKMKEIWTYMGRSFSGAERPLKEIIRAKTVEDYRDAVRAVFDEGRWRE